MLMLRNIGIDAFLAAFVLLTLFSCQYVQGDLYHEHTKLLNKLFHNYDEVSRPSPGSKYPVNVTLGIAVAQLVKVDERMEGMNLNVWYRMAWNDYRLSWDPQQHGNITNFKVDSDHLWIPDIMLTKPLSSEAGQILGLKKSDDDLAWKIGVSSDGTAAFNFPGSIYGQCSLTISDYPYDEHRCSFVFASWVHDGSELILKLRPDNPLDLGNYVFNNEWHIVGTEAKAIEERYECCPAPFYMTSFNIHVRRGASSYVSNYIIPSILIAILSIMMFTLPPEVGKRMEIGINLLLCLSVYLTILNTKMPTRSDAFPLLSKFYGCCIFILTCALLCTCWVVAYYFHDMSGWEIYTMSKFVEVGVLKYLRRALRFPNATKVYPSDILESVNSQRIIEVKPLMTEKTNFAGNSPAYSPDGGTKPAKEAAKRVTKENKSKIPVEKLSSNVEKKKKTDRKELTNQNEDSLPQNKKREKTLTETKDIDGRVEKQNRGDQGKADDKEKKIAKKKMRENLDNTKPKEDQAPEKETKDSKKMEKKEGRKDVRRKRDKSEGGDGGKVEKKPKASKEDKRDETRKGSDTTTSKESDKSNSKESDKSTRKEGNTTTNKESDKSTRKESNKSTRKESDTTTGKESDKNTRSESDKSTRREDDTTTSKESDTNTRRESDTSTTKESDKSTRRENDTTTSKESDTTTRRERDTSTTKESDKSTRRENDTTTSKESDTTTRRESDTTVNIRNSRSASRESNTSQKSKKSNNVFGATVAPGLVEKPRKERRRTKPKKEDLGVVNLGADNEEEKSKKIGIKNGKDGSEEATKVSNVRESPSLKDKTGEIGGDEKPSEKVSALAKMPSIIGQATAAPDAKQSFDPKQERKKKHDSVKLLKELSKYFSDHLERKKNRYQWRQAAIVLNRLFLIILCISIAMSIILVFLAR